MQVGRILKHNIAAWAVGLLLISTAARAADDYKLGRLKLRIPDVLGTRVSGWALPAFPLAA